MLYIFTEALYLGKCKVTFYTVPVHSRDSESGRIWGTLADGCHKETGEPQENTCKSFIKIHIQDPWRCIDHLVSHGPSVDKTHHIVRLKAAVQWCFTHMRISINCDGSGCGWERFCLIESSTTATERTLWWDYFVKVGVQFILRISI